MYKYSNIKGKVIWIVRFDLTIVSTPHICPFLFYSSPFVFTILHTMAPLINNGLEFYIVAALSEPRSQLYIKSWHVKTMFHLYACTYACKTSYCG